MSIRSLRWLLFAAAMGIGPTAAAQSCGVFTMSFVSPAAGFTAFVGQPVDIKIQVNQCGSGAPFTDGTVLVNFSNGDQNIALVHQGNGLWEHMWTPVNAVDQQVVLTALAASASLGVQGALQAGSVKPPPPAFTFDNTNLTFSLTAGGFPATQTINVFNNSPQPQQASIQTVGGSWLSASLSSATVPAGGSQAIQVTVDPSALAVGSISGAVSVSTANGSASALVSVATGPPAAPVQITADTLNLSVTLTAGGTPASQTVVLHNGNAAAVGYSVQSSAAWLTAQPNPGNIAADSPQNLTVTFAPGQLAAGSYPGSLTIQPTGGIALSITATLTLQAPPTPTLTLSATSFSLSATSGGAAQNATLNLSNQNAIPVNFSITASQPWLSANPSSGTVAGGGSMAVTLSANPSQLAAGSYTASLSVTSSSSTGSVTTQASVGLGVSPAPASPSCQPTKVLTSILAPPPNSSVTLGQAVALQVNVLDDCGTPLSGSVGAAAVTFSNSDPQINLTSTSNGKFLGTWTPHNGTTGSQVTIQVTGVELGKSNIASGVATVTVKLAGTSTVPPQPAAVTDAAASASTMTIAPGEAVTFYGNQMADCVAAVQLPLPTQLCGAQVLLEGLPLPLFYASPGQINTQVPFGLPLGSQLQLVVVRDNLMSKPFAVTVALAQPAMFTFTYNARGQAAALDPSGQLNGPSNPLHPGQVVLIFCSGLGDVTGFAGTPGAPAQSGVPASTTTLSATKSAPSVTIGGVPAPVFFSGLAPGFVGLYQVNAQVPTGVASGGQVPLVITIGGQTSPTATLVVQNP